MKFLEADEILSHFSGGDALPFLLGMSGSAEPLHIYLRAQAARRGLSAEPRQLAFGTLGQALHESAAPGETEVFLLLPWDFAAALDWRSGLPWDGNGRTVEELRDSAWDMARRLASRPSAHFLYLPAPVPPLFPDPVQNSRTASFLTALAASIGARQLPGEWFSLASYLASGCPIGGAWLGNVADRIIDALVPRVSESCKVLATDLDQVLWAGVIGDDGMEGISYGPEGSGFRHFIYQSFLAKLKQEGVVLAAVSRNQPEVGLEPLRSRRMLLSEEDFATVICSYNAKSAQIAEIASQLNLSLDSIVFVDDNPLELTEVSAALPGVHCVPFPSSVEALPEVLARLAHLFGRASVTSEDRARTELYRRRLRSLIPSQAKGAELVEFLRDLKMVLSIHDRSMGMRERAVQLINKTNQFNLNGQRISDSEVQSILAAGGRLLTVTLADRNGTHGEILACLITADRVMKSFVMSCRVFQRRVEHAFLSWLASQPFCPELLEFRRTSKNLPLAEFLNSGGFSEGPSNQVRLDAAHFSSHAADLELFQLHVDEALAAGPLAISASSARP